MKRWLRHGCIAVFATLALLGGPRAALAACTGPAGVAGTITWNGTDSVIWCNGTVWYSLKDTGGVAAGSTGQLQFNNGSNAFAADSNLTWDNTNKRLGIGTTSPLARLSVGNGSLADGNTPIQISSGASGSVAYFGANKNGGYGALFGYDNGLQWQGTIVRGVDTNPIHFLVNSTTEAMTINGTSGNVGIGTTSPTYLLSLGGEAARTFGMERTTAGTDGYRLTVSAGGAKAATADLNGGDLTLVSGISTGTGSSNIYFATATPQGTTSTTDNLQSTKMTIAGNGNVGIANKSPPVYTLTLGREATRTIGIERSSPNNGGTSLIITAGGSVPAVADKAGGNLYLDSGAATGLGSSNIYFRTATPQGSTSTTDNTPDAKMTILGNGNVGIGTTTPTFPLSFGTSTGNKIGLYETGTGTGYGIGISANVLQLFASASTDRVGLGYGNSAGFTETLSVKGARVGINTNNPTGDLSFGGESARNIYMERAVSGTTGSNLNITAGGAKSGTADLAGGNLVLSAGVSTGTGTSGIYFQTPTPGASASTDNAQSYKMAILGNGNVGIGTSAPAYKLDILSTSAITSGTSLAALNYVNVTPSGASSASYTGATNDVRVTSGVSTDLTGSIVAQNNYMRHAGTGVLDQGYGATNQYYATSTGNTTYGYGSSSEARSSGANTIANGYGAFNRAIVNGASSTMTTGNGAYNVAQITNGTMTNAVGSRNSVYSTTTTTIASAKAVTAEITNGSTAAITNAYGVQASLDNTGGGAITNWYGLHIPAVTGTAPTNRYPLYIVDTGTSYFAGSVLIGRTTASASSTPAALTIQHTYGVNYGLVLISDNVGASSVVRFDNPNGNVGSIVVAGTGVTYNTASDRRLKENIIATDGAMDKVMRIPVYDFSFKSDPAHKLQTGFIAQELEKVFPEAVMTNGDDGISPLVTNAKAWSVDYGRLTPLLLRAIQEQKAANDNQAARIDTLEGANDNLATRLEAVETELRALRAAQH